jgi:hypothetical protein
VNKPACNCALFGKLRPFHIYIGNIRANEGLAVMSFDRESIEVQTASLVGKAL